MTSRVEIHPDSIKYIKKGHPWITKDRFSEKFPKGAKFLGARIDETQFVVLLNDPNHSQVKARVWNVSNKSRIEDKDFLYDLKGRLYNALNLREEQNFGRDNYYLCFGEADQIPGIFIQRLGTTILIQFYSEFWNHFERDVIRIVRERFPEDTYWIQKRNHSKTKEFYCSSHKRLKEDEFVIDEYGVQYKLRFNQYYDIGIYTDMSAIRKKLVEEFENKKVLNLYCYTGAYSLFALKNGADSVTSVDLSQRYLNWLEENLELNVELDSAKHKSICKSANNALDQFVKEDKKFDVIICDPPSSSSDGKKITKAIDAYKELIPLIDQCLEKKGKAFIFLNTHSITRKKFETKIREYIGKRQLSIFGTLKLNEDCASLKGFPEGDYLKGLILYKR